MLVAVAGLIGAGKSTLVGALDGHRFYEPVETNPYLELYYQDMYRWCFPMQVHLLYSRWEIIQQAYWQQKDGSLAILDRSIYEDWAFAWLGYKAGYMSKLEYDTYCRMHEHLCTYAIPFPDLILYLDAPIDCLLEHIRSRDRGCEAGIMREYLEKLQAAYNELLPSIGSKVPLKVIDARQSKEAVVAEASAAILARKSFFEEQRPPRYRGGV